VVVTGAGVRLGELQRSVSTVQCSSGCGVATCPKRRVDSQPRHACTADCLRRQRMDVAETSDSYWLMPHDESNPENDARTRENRLDVRRLLLRWDPIGVGEGAEAQDEYDYLISPLMQQLFANVEATTSRSS
jgi:hypothetical protein